MEITQHGNLTTLVRAARGIASLEYLRSIETAHLDEVVCKGVKFVEVDFLGTVTRDSGVPAAGIHVSITC